jgi:hypothetical protein
MSASALFKSTVGEEALGNLLLEACEVPPQWLPSNGYISSGHPLASSIQLSQVPLPYAPPLHRPPAALLPTHLAAEDSPNIPAL